METIIIKLNLILEYIYKKNYVEAINLIQELQDLNNTDLNKYLIILLDLFSVISGLSKKQKDSIKGLTYNDVFIDKSDIFSDINKENEKRNLVLQKKYSELMEDFDKWDVNVYQNILKILIKLAKEAEDKFENNFSKAVFERKYEHAKNILENKLIRQRASQEEKVTYQILSQMLYIMKTKSLPNANFTDTDDYIQAISNNDFELAFKLIVNRYINETDIVLTRLPDYLLLRDICKLIENVKNYNNYCVKYNIYNQDVQDTEFLTNKYDEIKKYGLVTIKTKNKNRIAKVLMDVINYPDISATLLCNDEMLMLKYNPYVDTYSKVTKLMSEANRLSAKKRTKEALNLYLEALKFENVRSTTFSKVGLCFVELKSFSRAIEYLTVAMEIGKNEGKIFDFYSLIARLEGKLSDNDIKPHFQNKENKFDFCGQNVNFGMGDLTELNNNIILSGLDVENACLSLGVSEEKTQLIKLVYAREFFSNGEEKIAEKFIKSVELNDNKTPRVINALNEVRKNKKMYVNKKETTLVLSLKLKPQK